MRATGSGGGARRALRAVAMSAVAGAFLLAPAALLAGVAEAAEAAPDFRGKVTLAYGLVFVCVVVYLVASHRRNAALREEVAFLERRLAELESKRPG